MKDEELDQDVELEDEEDDSDWEDDDWDAFSLMPSDEQDRLLTEAVQSVLEGKWSKIKDDPDSPLAVSLRDLLDETLTRNSREGYVRRLANSGKPLSADDMKFLSQMAGHDDSGFSPLDEDDGGVTDEMLEGYAKYLRNYLYRYKDEAQEIDPNIDPQEDHKGPMAQDIEKVAPDCVNETPEGVKTVDGNRLALVNAGVIGELARRVMELEERLNGKR